MSGKEKGIYRLVAKKYALSEVKYKGGTFVAILECKHAVILKNNNKDPVRTWCYLCTKARREEATEKLRKSAHAVQPTFDEAVEQRIKNMVEAGVAAALEKLTAPKIEMSGGDDLTVDKFSQEDV